MKVIYTLYLSIKLNGKLQFTHMWFDRNLSYLLVVWNLILYPSKFRSIRFL